MTPYWGLLTQCTSSNSDTLQIIGNNDRYSYDMQLSQHQDSLSDLPRKRNRQPHSSHVESLKSLRSVQPLEKDRHPHEPARSAAPTDTFAVQTREVQSSDSHITNHCLRYLDIQTLSSRSGVFQRTVTAHPRLQKVDDRLLPVLCSQRQRRVLAQLIILRTGLDTACS
jgi:hypothetical protein